MAQGLIEDEKLLIQALENIGKMVMLCNGYIILLFSHFKHNSSFLLIKMENKQQKNAYIRHQQNITTLLTDLEAELHEAKRTKTLLTNRYEKCKQNGTITTQNRRKIIRR